MDEPNDAGSPENNPSAKRAEVADSLLARSNV